MLARKLSSFVLALSLGVLGAHPVASGQSQMAPLSPTREMAETSVALRPPDTAPLDLSLRRRPRRARFLIAVGVGMLVGSAIHVGWAYPNRVCSDSHELKASLYGAGLLGGIGASFTIGGGTWLGLSSRRQYPASRGQLVAASAFALGAALGTQALLFVTHAFDGVGCSS